MRIDHNWRAMISNDIVRWRLPANIPLYASNFVYQCICSHHHLEISMNWTERGNTQKCHHAELAQKVKLANFNKKISELKRRSGRNTIKYWWARNKKISIFQQENNGGLFASSLEQFRTVHKSGGGRSAKWEGKGGDTRHSSKLLFKFENSTSLSHAFLGIAHTLNLIYFWLNQKSLMIYLFEIKSEYFIIHCSWKVGSYESDLKNSTQWSMQVVVSTRSVSELEPDSLSSALTSHSVQHFQWEKRDGGAGPHFHPKGNNCGSTRWNSIGTRQPQAIIFTQMDVKALCRCIYSSRMIYLFK